MGGIGAAVARAVLRQDDTTALRSDDPGWMQQIAAGRWPHCCSGDLHKAGRARDSRPQSDGKIDVTDRSSRVPQAARARVDSPGNSTEGEVAQRTRAVTEQRPLLLKVARGLCREKKDVEDLVHDVILKALDSIHTLDLNHNPRGWMVTILYNLHIDSCRELARRQHVPVDDIQLSSPEPDDTPTRFALDENDVRQAAAQLPDELRETYILFAFEGRSYNEIADQLGIAKATVGTRILRARAHLKRLLSASLPEERA